MTPRAYVDTNATRSTAFTLTKVIEYAERSQCEIKMMYLDLLQGSEFGRVHIPKFEATQLSPTSIRIVSEYIKGRYANPDEMRVVEADVVYRKSKFSFDDFNANNYIVEGRSPWKIYMVDLDCFGVISEADRERKFAACAEQHTRYHEWYG